MPALERRFNQPELRGRKEFVQAVRKARTLTDAHVKTTHDFFFKLFGGLIVVVERAAHKNRAQCAAVAGLDLLVQKQLAHRRIRAKLSVKEIFAGPRFVPAPYVGRHPRTRFSFETPKLDLGNDVPGNQNALLFRAGRREQSIALGDLPLELRFFLSRGQRLLPDRGCRLLGLA